MNSIIFKKGGLLVLLLILVTAITGCDSGSFTERVTYELIVNMEGEGEVTPEIGSHEYDQDASVNIEAEPAYGWKFVRWTGDVESNNSSEQILMNQNKEVTAIFNITDEHELYNNDFSLIYPKEWFVDEVHGELILSPDDSGFMVITRDELGHEMDEDEFKDEINALENEFENDDNIEIEESSSRFLDGQPAHSFLLSSYESSDPLNLSIEDSNIDRKINNLNTKLEEVFYNLETNYPTTKINLVITFKEDQIYLIMYAHTIDLFDDYFDEVNDIIDSFEFNR